MQIGVIGKTNVGKSTFFTAATETTAQIGNYPFTTIEPNIGITYVKSECACKQFDIKHTHPMCLSGIRYIPVKLIDVAGLVPGAHEGKGLGNKFLDDARQAEVLIHVVDISGSTDIQGHPIPVGMHDPLEDIKFVEEEFDLWMKQILQRDWQKLSRELESKNAKLVQVIAQRFSGLGIKEYEVEAIIHHMNLQSRKPTEWTDSDISLFISELRKKTKPMIVAANKADLCPNLEIIDTIKKERPVIGCSAESELLLKKASKNGLIDYNPGETTFKIRDPTALTSQQHNALNLVNTVLEKIKSTGVQQTLNSACFDLLKLIVVYPVEDETRLSNKEGQVLPDARLLPLGSTSKELAFTIHADLAKGFLYAVDVKTKQRIGAEHKLKNGDVIKIVSTLSRG